MDGLNLVFCILCIIAGILTGIGGILWIAAIANFISVVIGIYLLIFGLYIIIVEIFMPARLAGWLGFYCTWVGKALFYIFIGVLLLLPYRSDVPSYGVYFLCAAIYLFIVSLALIVLQILACASVHSYSTCHSIIVVKTSSSSSLGSSLSANPSSS